jgi:hypothetical protein
LVFSNFIVLSHMPFVCALHCMNDDTNETHENRLFSKNKGWDPIKRFNPAPLCVCHKLGSWILTSWDVVGVFFVCSAIWGERLLSVLLISVVDQFMIASLVFSNFIVLSHMPFVCALHCMNDDTNETHENRLFSKNKLIHNSNNHIEKRLRKWCMK